MLNVLIPMSGPNRFDEEEFTYPKPLIEIMGRPLIEHVIAGLDQMRRQKRFICVVNEEDCDKYYLADVLGLITKGNVQCIRLKQSTKGAACSALMAIDYINNEQSLLISNSDHVLECDLEAVLDRFDSRGVDAGVVCFEAVHPKWSYVRLDEAGKIVETAEKRPLSRNAIAGLYYFRRGSDFVRAAKGSIEKDASVNGLYYIAPVLNELILEGANLESVSVPASAYHNFYSPHKLREYETYLSSKVPS